MFILAEVFVVIVGEIYVLQFRVLQPKKTREYHMKKHKLFVRFNDQKSSLDIY